MQDFKRLIAFHKAKQRAPKAMYTGRRIAKDRAKGYGQILKHSTIKELKLT